MDNCIIHFLPAKAGDCFVLEFKNKECIIIDCGFKSTYRDYLKPLLIKLNRKGCVVTLLVITHIDQDHIEGAISLIEENGRYDKPTVIPIKDIWFNGVFGTLFCKSCFAGRTKNITNKQKAKTKDSLKELLLQVESGSHDISAKQSISFEEICLKNGYQINRHFKGKEVRRNGESRQEIQQESIDIGCCKISVLSPSAAEIERLADYFDDEMKCIYGMEYGLSNDSDFKKMCELFLELQSQNTSQSEYISAGEGLTSWLGTSSMSPMNLINCASIVLEIEFQGKKMLFTGDSNSGLWKHLVAQNYDLIKVSHHGTMFPNKELFQVAKGKKLLISTNGGNSSRHPEKELLATVILAGNTELYFNYSIKQKTELLNFQKEFSFQANFEQIEIEL